MDYHGINKAYYDRNALRYEAASWYFFNKYKTDSVRAELRRCSQFLQSKPVIRVLEIGPGTGYLLGTLLSISKSQVDYTGLDHSSEMAKIITERYQSSCRTFRIIVDTVTAAALQRYDQDQRYDLVMGSSILCHLQDYAEVIAALSRLVDDGGLMYFVREPLHGDDCRPASAISGGLERAYDAANQLLMSPPVRNRLWPKKVKAADASGICPPNFDEGVSMRAFEAMESAGFRRIFLRKYNRRVSWILSYLENKWLGSLRKDIFGNTLYAIALQRVSGHP